MRAAARAAARRREALCLRWMAAAGVVLAALGACGGGGAADAAPGGAGPSATLAAAPPAALVGTWGFAAATGNYCDPLGDCTPGSGGSESFTIDALGRTAFALFESSLLPGCGEIRTLTRKLGSIAVSGDRMVFAPSSGTYEAHNACRPDLSGSWTLAAADLAPVALTWQLVPDPQDPSRSALQIVDPTGQASGVYGRR